MIFCVHLSPSFWGGGFPCDFNSLIDLRSVVDFPLVRMGVRASYFQALYSFHVGVVLYSFLGGILITIMFLNFQP